MIFRKLVYEVSVVDEICELVSRKLNNYGTSLFFVEK